ncbi:MAG TPA: hypothetical protein VEZ11_18175, partial [Thermoanaerobaculia bacterium]|nr:hypothetical protein [Thermoanaerobaculia bacterium]
CVHTARGSLHNGSPSRADLADVFCARCGERQPGHHDLSVSHFASCGGRFAVLVVLFGGSLVAAVAMVR